MTEIVAFIEAQLNADERLARAAGATRSGKVASWNVTCGCAGEHADDCYERRVEGDNIVIYNEGGHDEDQARHISRHDPVRVLAEVVAKRAVLAGVLSWKHEYIDGDSWYSCSQAVATFGEEDGPGSGCADEDRAGGPCDCGLDRRRAAILYALAAPYADRPGYKQEWAVETAGGDG